MSQLSPAPALPAGQRDPALPLPGHLLESLRDFDLPRPMPGAPAQAIAPPDPNAPRRIPAQPKAPPSASKAKRLQVTKSGVGGTPARCRWQGCGEFATHYPHLSVHAVGRLRGDHGPLRVVLAMPLCRMHARRPGWLTRPIQEQIAEAFAAGGKAPPDFKRAVLGYTPIRSGEHPHSRDPRD